MTCVHLAARTEAPFILRAAQTMGSSGVHAFVEPCSTERARTPVPTWLKVAIIIVAKKPQLPPFPVFVCSLTIVNVAV